MLTHPALWCAAAAIALYLPSLGYGFVWDDHAMIEGATSWARAGGLWRMLVSDFWAPVGSAAGFWRPVVVLSYWLDGLLFHTVPAGFHATNIAAHAAATAVLVLLIVELGGSRIAAAVAGLWFATLPSSVECVAWVSGRTDLLAGMFVLLAYWLDRGSRSKGRAAPPIAAVAAFALALLSKETAALMLAPILIAEWLRPPARGFEWRSPLRWLAPYAVVTVVYLAAHALWVRPTPGPTYLDPTRLARTGWAAWTIFPRSLLVLSPGFVHNPGLELPLPAHGPDLAVALAIAFHVAVLVALVVLLARRARAALPLAMIAIPFVPLTVGTMLRGDPLYAERYFYLPAAGVALWLALAIDAWGAGPPQGRGLAAAVAALAALGAFQTVGLQRLWRDDLTLYGAMCARAPGAARNHVYLADELLRERRLEPAQREYVVADSLLPGQPTAALGQGYIEYQRGHLEAALAFTDRALRADSLEVNGRVLRASLLLRLGRREEAELTLAPVVAAGKHSGGLDALWGKILLDAGRADEAARFLADAEPRHPGDTGVPFLLGLAEARRGRPAEARAAFERVVALDPRYYSAWLELAVACQSLGDVAGRERALERAAALPEAGGGALERFRRTFPDSGIPVQSGGARR